MSSRLDEIAGLTSAWDGDRCGPVQDQLRQLVADEIIVAQDQLADLTLFTKELQQAAAGLERHRPTPAEPVPVTLGSTQAKPVTDA